MKEAVPKEWLQQKLETRDFVELVKQEANRLGIVVDSGMLESIQRMQEKWNAFIADEMNGDELWYYESPPHTWNALCGAAGYAIVREGRPIKNLTIRRN